MPQSVSTDLSHLIAHLTPVLAPGRYVFLTIPIAGVSPMFHDYG